METESPSNASPGTASLAVSIITSFGPRASAGCSSPLVSYSLRSEPQEVLSHEIVIWFSAALPRLWSSIHAWASVPISPYPVLDAVPSGPRSERPRLLLASIGSVAETLTLSGSSSRVRVRPR